MTPMERCYKALPQRSGTEVLILQLLDNAGGRILTHTAFHPCSSHPAAARQCGGQDSNLRTDKDWDLNPPPLTKLGDPRATRG